MREIREIVVGVDESVVSERALDRALLHGQQTGRPVRVLHTWMPPVWLGGASGPYGLLADSESVRLDLGESARQVAQDLLDKALARLTSDRPVEATVEVVCGGAGPQLVHRAWEADLLVVGGRGLGIVKSALLGSATSYVLHHASCPVMVVPESGTPTGGFHRVVVGVDGSRSSRSALRWGLAAAQREGVPLVALHSWLSTTVPHPASETVPPTLKEYQQSATAWLAAEVAEALPDTGGVVVQQQVRHSTPAWGLLDEVSSDDLLVLGSRGRGGFASLVLGSVATQCSQHTPATLVVLREGHEHRG